MWMFAEPQAQIQLYRFSNRACSKKFNNFPFYIHQCILVNFGNSAKYDDVIKIVHQTYRPSTHLFRSIRFHYIARKKHTHFMCFAFNPIQSKRSESHHHALVENENEPYSIWKYFEGKSAPIWKSEKACKLELLELELTDCHSISKMHMIAHNFWFLCKEMTFSSKPAGFWNDGAEGLTLNNLTWNIKSEAMWAA